MKKFNPYDHIGFLTNRIGRLLSNHMSCIMENEDIHAPSSCIGVLADLWAKDGINQKDLGISLIKTKSSINKMLAALVTDGMITKEDDPNDKRGKLIYLTTKGRRMQNHIEKASTCCDLKIIEDVSKEDLETTKRVLGQYYEMLLDQASTSENNKS